MTVPSDFNRSCMRFGTIKYETRKLRRVAKVQLLEPENICEGIRRKIITKREFAELLFENCIDCGRMSAIPQGAFAACKVRRNLERNTAITAIGGTEKMGKENIFNVRSPPGSVGRELTPLQYNSKLMNSIWGLYNRYSVHNFKKNTDANEGVYGMFVAVWGGVHERQTPAANTVAVTAATMNSS